MTPRPKLVELWVLRLALLCWPQPARDDVAEELRATFEARRARGGGPLDLLLEALDVAWAGIRARWTDGRGVRTPTSGGGRTHGPAVLGPLLAGALRGLGRSPGWTVLTGGVLFIGIATAVSVFAVVDVVAIRPLPYPESELLVRIGAERDGRPGLSTISAPDFRDIAAEVETLSAVAAGTPSMMSVASDASTPDLVRGGWVSGAFFEVLGVGPAEGRPLGVGDDVTSAPLTAVLSHRLAARLLGSGPHIDRTISIDGRMAVVVGVMPRDFHPPEGAHLGDTELWAPLAHAPLPVSERGLAFLDAVGLIKHGVPMPLVQQELSRIGEGLIEAHGKSSREFAALVARPLRDETVAGTRPLIALLLAAVGLVLSIAILNSANLTLLRVLDRMEDMRVRLALGASRIRLVSESVVEGMMVALVGGGAGIAVAALAVGAVAADPPVDLARIGEAAVDMRVASIALLLAVAAGILAGLLPALVVVRSVSVGRSYRGGRSQTRGTRLLRDAVVAGQVALGLVLAGGAALVGRSLAELRNVPIGLDATNLHAATLRIDGIGGDDFAPSVLEDLVSAALTAPGVAAAGLGSGSPYVPGGFVGYLEPDGIVTSDEDRVRGRVEFHRVGPAPLALLGVELLRGRDLAESDRQGSEPVVVITESVARAWWGDVDPLGRTVVLGGDGSFTPRRVVGIARTPRYRGPASTPEEHLWVPWSQMPPAPLDLLVRIDGEVAAERLVADVAEQIPGVAVRGVRSVQEELEARYVEPAFFAGLFAFFGAAALLFAVLGLYSTLAFVVRVRRNELGIRMVLGAARGRLVRGFVVRGAMVTAVGLGLGGLLAVSGARLTRSLLFGVGPWDPRSWAVAVLLLGGASILASGIPAWRAGRTDPAESLRAE